MRKVVYLSLGSNLGDRAANLNDAIARLNKIGDVVAESSIYETEPVEFTAQPWFLNCIIAIDILLFGSSIVDTKNLTIPHAALHERRFVLEPLVEIAADVRHPVFKRSMREL